MGAFGVKKRRVTGYCIADRQTDRRTVKTSGKTLYNTTKVPIEKMGRQLAAFL
jgi:hypothetical protein